MKICNFFYGAAFASFCVSLTMPTTKQIGAMWFVVGTFMFIGMIFDDKFKVNK